MELARESGAREAATTLARRINVYVEDIDYRGARGLDKSVIRWCKNQPVGTHENVFVLGPTGVGKSFVACALAQKASRRVLLLSTPEP